MTVTIPPTQSESVKSSHVHVLELTEIDGSYGAPLNSDTCNSIKAAGNYPPNPADKCRCDLYIKNIGGTDYLCWMCSDRVEHCVCECAIPTPTPTDTPGIG